MIHIPIEVVDGVINPVGQIPDDAIQIVCDGEKYIVYQSGDDLPAITESTEAA